MSSPPTSGCGRDRGAASDWFRRWETACRFTSTRQATSIVLGTGAGQEEGALFFPLSVDRGPDGRYFVLDAGNARIQVFDAEGKYLTQWGRGEVGTDGFDSARVT